MKTAAPVNGSADHVDEHVASLTRQFDAMDEWLRGDGGEGNEPAIDGSASPSTSTTQLAIILNQHDSATVPRAIVRWIRSVGGVQFAWWVTDAQSCGRLKQVDDQNEADEPRRSLVIGAAVEAAWPNPSPPQIIAKQLRRDLSLPHLTILPLAIDNAVADDVLIIAGDDLRNSASPDWRHVCELITTHLAMRRRHQNDLERGIIRRCWNRFRKFWSGRLRQCLLAASVIVAGLSLLPMPLRIDGEGIVLPVKRRYVAAPADAPLAMVHVAPGDRVTTGTVLAELDPRDLKQQLSSAQTDVQIAEATLREARSRFQPAEINLAQLEVAKHRSHLDHLERMQRRWSIRSPVDAIVVEGDWQAKQGIPVERGQTLFELAEVDQVEIELRIPQDLGHEVKLGMPVRIDAPGLSRRWATVQRLFPAATVVDGDNVMIARATLAGGDSGAIEDDRLRIGMRTRTQVRGDRYPAAWSWLRQPYRWFRHTVL